MSGYMDNGFRIGRHLKHARRALQIVRGRIDVLRDYWAFRRRFDFLSRIPRTGGPSKLVLIVSLTNWVCQVKQEGILAKALQLRGFTPIVVTHRTNTQAIRYFQVFGIDLFAFFDDLLPPETEASWAEADDLLQGAPSFQDLVHLRYRGVDIGRAALSTVLRQHRFGSIDPNDRAVRPLVRDALHFGIRSVQAAERLVGDTRAHLALFNERGYLPYGAIFDVALNDGVVPIQFTACHRPNAYMLRRYTPETSTTHPFSLSDESWRVVRQMPWTPARSVAVLEEIRRRYETGTWFAQKFLDGGRRILTAEEVRQRLVLDQNRKVAVVFSHVLWDATFFYGENIFDDYEEWLVETVKAACKNDAVDWVIKLHPDYVWKQMKAGDGTVRDVVAIRERVGELPSHVRVLPPDTDIHPLSLFGVTDYCVTARGTIGMEMACFGIPVFTAGTGRYSGLGFTIDSKNRHEYIDKMLRVQEFPRLSPEQVELAQRYAFGVFMLRPFQHETFQTVLKPLDQITHPLAYNVDIRARSQWDLEAAADLGAFAAWATASTSLDFLTDPMSDAG